MKRAPRGSAWARVARAPTPSQAVELAALLPPGTPLDLPVAVSALPPRCRHNLAAVARALSLHLPGVPPPPPPPAYAAALDASPSAQALAPAPPSTSPPRSPAPEQPASPASPPLSSSDAAGAAPRAASPSLAAAAVGTSAAPLAATAAAAAADADKAAAPTAAEVDAALALRRWATEAPHTPAPAAALARFSAAESATAVMRVAFPDDLPSQAAAALLAAVAAACGARTAAAAGASVVAPRLRALTAPAPRDMMAAVVAFADAHWRAAVPLFSMLGAPSAADAASGPAAEVLVRVAGALSAESAREALVLGCEGLWREEAVPVVEALLTKCSTEEGVADVLVPALERNIVGMESSIRFGKLLFVCTKNVPAIRSAHASNMRSIAGKSTVFLSKRALALLGG